MITDAEIAGTMGWRGPGAYTEASMRKIRELVATAVHRERAACAAICDQKSAEYLARSPRRQHSQGAGIVASICAEEIRRRSAA